MTTILPELVINQHRRFDFVIFCALQTAANIALDLTPERGAIVMPEHHALRFGLHVEKAQLLTQTAMIACFGFGELMQMLI